MLTHTVLSRLRRPVGTGEQQKLVAALHEFAAEAPFTAGPVQVDVGLRDPPNIHIADAFARCLDHSRHRALVSEVLEPFCESWLSLQNEVEAEPGGGLGSHIRAIPTFFRGGDPAASEGRAANAQR